MFFFYLCFFLWEFTLGGSMLRIKKFGMKYKNDTIFENANLEISQGEIVVISGKSGCGKSSLLKAINGIITEVNDVQTMGDIEFDGHSILENGISKRSRLVSTVFQNPKTQFYCTNTTDELAFALENKNISQEEILRTIKEYTGALKTTHLLNRNIFKLSGGEKQLVAITAVACMNNLIYLMDEPSASLDQDAIQQLKHTLIKLKSMGKIVIVAEHRLYYLADIMDQLAVLDCGEMNVYDMNVSNKHSIEEIVDRHELRVISEIKKKDLLDMEFHTISLTGGDYDNRRGALVCDKFLTCFDQTKILDLSLSFSPGINFIIGKNGVGKTTFIKKLAGLSRGKGKSYFEKVRIKRSYEFISMVMQDVNYQLFTESVWQEISVVSSNTERKKKILEEIGLYEKKDLHPQVLSGGEKQRLLIALAIVSDKPIIILDEPTSGLCKNKMMRIIDYIHEMQSMGKVIIVITHDYEFIQICRGRVFEFVK